MHEHESEELLDNEFVRNIIVDSQLKVARDAFDRAWEELLARTSQKAPSSSAAIILDIKVLLNQRTFQNELAAAAAPVDTPLSETSEAGMTGYDACIIFAPGTERWNVYTSFGSDGLYLTLEDPEGPIERRFSVSVYTSAGLIERLERKSRRGEIYLPPIQTKRKPTQSPTRTDYQPSRPEDLKMIYDENNVLAVILVEVISE